MTHSLPETRRQKHAGHGLLRCPHTCRHSQDSGKGYTPISNPRLGTTGHMLKPHYPLTCLQAGFYLPLKGNGPVVYNTVVHQRFQTAQSLLTDQPLPPAPRAHAATGGHPSTGRKHHLFAKGSPGPLRAQPDPSAGAAGPWRRLVWKMETPGVTRVPAGNTQGEPLCQEAPGRLKPFGGQRRCKLQSHLP